ncbi:hypothetical protein ATANTOWER_021582 [Ataeniobius toweri]|uniref:Ig-like domain-containing protein n=1 Tax=Ataeniobius toweri TaxID=208326 RepID=A0ABU7AGV8_9TELE|nr:hypothetical protein [Ataeniobius toweri]
MYTCRESVPQQEGRYFQVHLVVVSITEHMEDSRVSLHCSVMDHRPCRQTVEWLHVDRNEKATSLQTSQPSCTVSVLTLHNDLVSTYQVLLKCKVTDQGQGKVQIFNPRPASSGKNIIKSTAETELPTSTPMSSTAQQDCCCSALDYIIFVIHLAEVFLVTFIAFHFFRAQGKDKVADTSVLNSVTRRLVNHSGVESMSHDEEDCTANYVNFRSPAPAANLNIQQEHHIC